jgi:hypothetical protein
MFLGVWFAATLAKRMYFYCRVVVTFRIYVAPYCPRCYLSLGVGLWGRRRISLVWRFRLEATAACGCVGQSLVRAIGGVVVGCGLVEGS